MNTFREIYFFGEKIMKKVLAIMFVAVLCVASVFALEFNLGVKPQSGFETLFFASQDIANVEVGAGVVSNVPAGFVRAFMDTTEASIIERAKIAFNEATSDSDLDVMGYVVFNAIKTDEFKLGAGLFGIYSINGTAEIVPLSAIIKTSFKFATNRSIFALALAEVDFTDLTAFSVPNFAKSFTIGYSRAI